MLQSLPKNPLLNPVVLCLIILVEGFVSIATEILAMRQLLPFAGGSVIVTSLIIGIFLLFLALGYHQGGTIKQNAIQVLQRNFFIASIWLGVGLSYSFVSLFFIYVHNLLGTHLIYPLVAYLLLVIAPLIYLLGQTLPMTMNMVKQTVSAGHIGGYTLSLSTLGSFLGSVLTSLITLHYFGVAYTVVFNSCLLMLLALTLVKRDLKLIGRAAIYAVTLLLIVMLNVYAEQNMFVLTNSYANYQILDRSTHPLNKEKILIINEALSSKIDASGRGYPYIENIKKILFHDLKLHDQDILILGAGGFSLTAQGTNSNRFTYVDIDAQIKKATVPRFIDKMEHNFIADDARHFLRVSPQKYAAIVVDVYTDYKAIPAHLVTLQYLELIKQHLAERGTVIINLVANPRFTDRYSKHLDNTIHAAFNNCMTLPQTYSDEVTNILYVCTNAGVQDRLVYTDNLNHSTTDSFNW